MVSNHYHLVVYVNREAAQSWSEAEFIERGRKLFKRPPLVQRLAAGEALSAPEQSRVDAIVAKWRERLTDVSWTMRGLNEHLARKADREDGLTGRFWEGRFQCQALLDETALMTAMPYVDLKPVRAGVA